MAIRRVISFGVALVLCSLFAASLPDKPLAHDGPSHQCPRPLNPWDETPDNQFNAHRVVGKRLGVARRMARRHDCTVRVVRRNGKWLTVTSDFRPNRINVSVRHRRVVGMRGVG